MTKPTVAADWIFKAIMGLAFFLGSFWFYKLSDEVAELTKAQQRSAERLARIEAIMEANRDEIGRLRGIVEALRK